MEEISVFLRDWLVLILNAVLAAATPVLISFIVAWLNKKRQEVEASLNASQLEAYKFVAKNAVLAAEQLHLKNLITDRKNWAVDNAKAWLLAQGYKNVDVDTLAGFVEAALVEEFNRFKMEMDVPDVMKEGNTQ